MEPENNNLQKNIGTFVGVLTVIGVLFVTVFWGGSQSSTTTTPIATTQTPIDNSNNTNNVNTIQTTTTNKTTPTTPTKTTKTTTPPVVDTPKKSIYVYKDGTYSATGSYMSPGGIDQLAVTVTLKNDIVTNVSVIPQAGDRTSTRYQNMFIANYQPYVLGKNIASINLDTISGSSLTPAGFNNALTQIKSQAKA